jgi:hypothetical protein
LCSPTAFARRAAWPRPQRLKHRQGDHHGRHHPDHDRRAAQVRRVGIPQGLRPRRGHQHRRQHPRPVRRGRQVYFPKWGIADGKAEIGKLFSDVGGTLKSIKHDYASFNWIFSGADTIVAEGTSHGEHQDGTWRAGVPEWGAGRWCDVFEIRDFLIQRCFIYLDPDYAGRDTERYPWLNKPQ